ncbi:Hypothetical predicted protein [Cloeon dipterum]|uniref:O-acyltransferase WSD1 C-terminal domain-containing protein n=1 Tax=Cloeon dipterum TaxID=197152 RepID=A0A8S1CMY3_9INSE|nr:Hypothetical predicted protein [Cloeon dipterum]
MNTSIFNYSGYKPVPFRDDLTNYTNSRTFGNPLEQSREKSLIFPTYFGLATAAFCLCTCGTLKLIKASWIIWTLILLIAVVVMLPIISVLLLYKSLANLWLRGKILNGADTFWALDADDPASLAVINVLAIVSEDISLQQLKNAVGEKLVPSHPKLKHLRECSPFGYFFWNGQQKLNLDDYVKTIGCECNDEASSEEELREALSSLSNAQLPHNHLAGWEILLGPKLMYGGKTHRAIVFRIHHSMGDGPALFRALFSTLTDCKNMEVFTPNPETVKKIIDRIQSRYNNKFFDNVVAVGRSLRGQLLQPSDDNVLHGPKLSGQKQIAWCSSTQLMEAAKSIHNATGASFSAGLLASFLAAVSQFGNDADKLKACTIVFPVRALQNNPNTEPEMSNTFSCAVVSNRIPAMDDGVDAQIKAADEALKKATQPVVVGATRAILKLVGDVCPRPIANLALNSRQCTAAMSNMPGPQTKISVFGSSVEKLVFWVPNKRSTGVGVSILSYAGELSLGLNVDTALVNQHDAAKTLLLLWEEQLLLMSSVVGKKL